MEIKDGVEIAGPEALQSDLIVDATGRASKLPQWLERLGYPAPAELRVNARLGYASRFYEGVSLRPRAPRSPRVAGSHARRVAHP